MGVSKSMKTFTSAMQNLVEGGYGGKVVTTPMGPFKWDDLMEQWVNVNNGFVMSNISFMEMQMMGYDAGSGDNGTVEEDNIYIIPPRASISVSVPHDEVYYTITPLFTPSIPEGKTARIYGVISNTDFIALEIIIERSYEDVITTHAVNTLNLFNATTIYTLQPGTQFGSGGANGIRFRIKSSRSDPFTTPSNFTLTFKNSKDDSTIFVTNINTSNSIVGPPE
jgi:hypothetical protein